MGCFQKSVFVKLGYNPPQFYVFQIWQSSLKTFIWLKIKWKKRLHEKPGCHSLNSVLVNSEVMWKKCIYRSFIMIPILRLPNTIKALCSISMVSCELNQVIRKLLSTPFLWPLYFLLVLIFIIFTVFHNKGKNHSNLMLQGHSDVHDILIKSQIADSI